MAQLTKHPLDDVAQLTKHPLDDVIARAEKRLRATPFTVYILRGDGRLKIGHSRNWEKRVSNLQTACPFQLELAGLIQWVANGVEAEVHHALGAFRLRGEWFRDCPEAWEILRLFNVWKIDEDDYCPSCDTLGWDEIHPCDFCDFDWSDGDEDAGDEDET